MSVNADAWLTRPASLSRKHAREGADPETKRRRKINWLRTSVPVVVVAVAIQGVLLARPLFADGAAAALTIARNGGHWISDYARVFAGALIEIPTWVVVQAGHNDVPSVIYSLSFGSIAFAAAAWLLAFWIMRREDYFWTLAATYAVVAFGTGMLAIAEFQICYALSVLVAAILWKKERLNWFWIAVLLAASIVLTRSYSAALFLGAVLFAMAALRLTVGLASPPAPRVSVESIGLILTMGLLAASAALSLWDVALPRDPANLSNAMDLMFPLTRNHQFQIGAVVTLALVALWWLKVPTRVSRAMNVGIAGIAMLLFLPSTWSEPWMHYSSRTLAGLLLLFVLIGVSAGVIWTRWSTSRAAQVVVTGEEGASGDAGAASGGWRFSGLPGGVLFFASALVLASQTASFHTWLGQFQCSVRSSEGIVELGAAGLDEDLTRDWAWSWTNPYLSRLLQSTPDEGIILNPGQVWSDTTPSAIPLPSGLAQGEGLGFSCESS